jgi:hypothetical protein
MVERYNLQPTSWITGRTAWSRGQLATLILNAFLPDHDGRADETAAKPTSVRLRDLTKCIVDVGDDVGDDVDDGVDVGVDVGVDDVDEWL